MSLIYGLVTGIIFGILLQKAQVLKYDKQVGALRLLDMTIFKFMLTAVVVGAIGIYLLKDLGVIALKLKATSIGAQAIGGLCFGVGWGMLGYCPGTAGGALGEGRLDGFWGILGMLCGAMVFAAIYPALKAGILSIGTYGKITLSGAMGLNHWIIIVVLAAVVVLASIFFEKKRL
jgi:uncharacterized membrane protein YedE/YeeE